MHLFTHPTSNYPDRYKFGWIYGECVRILRNSSDQASFYIKLGEFKMNLKRNEYPEDLIKKYTNISYSNRHVHLQLTHREYDRRRKHIGIAHENHGQLVKGKIDDILDEAGLKAKFNTVLFRGKNLLTSVPANFNRLLDLFLEY
jgi:hypothetical protein